MRRGGTTVEPTQEGQDEWVQLIASLQMASTGFFESCTPGYYNNEGQAGAGLGAGLYTPGINAFNALLEQWRAQGDLAGLEIDRPTSDL